MGSDTNIESTDLSHLVKRVWVGNKYDYPNLSKLLTEIDGLRKSVASEHSFARQLEARLTTYKAECQAWRTMYATASGVINDSWPQEKLKEAFDALKAARSATDKAEKGATDGE